MSCLLVVTSFSISTSDFEDINTNKRVLAGIDASTIDNVYAYAQYNAKMVDWSFHNFSNIYANHWVQYFANIIAEYVGSDQNTILSDYVDSFFWNLFYGSCANNLESVLKMACSKLQMGFRMRWPGCRHGVNGA